MTSRFTALAVALVVMATPATSQQQIGEFFTYLSERDMRNSQGAPLRDACVVLQQDRANYHRFGRSDELDDFDPFFGSREMRARIPSICSIRPGYEYIGEAIRNGQVRYVWVRVYGSNGVPTRITMSEGAG